MLAPFIPATSAEILTSLGVDGEAYADMADVSSYTSIGSADKFGALKAGASVGDSRVMFARIDEAKMLAELEAEMEAKKAAAEAEAKKNAPIEKPEGIAQIGIDDFMKVELRVAQILECEPVPKAKKLLKLQIDLGYEKRQVVSGIAKWYKPEQLIGKKIAVVANLAPATLCGVESNGMILASGEEDVRVIFLDPDTKLGERIR